ELEPDKRRHIQPDRDGDETGDRRGRGVGDDGRDHRRRARSDDPEAAVVLEDRVAGPGNGEEGLLALDPEAVLVVRYPVAVNGPARARAVDARAAVAEAQESRAQADEVVGHPGAAGAGEIDAV